MDTISTVILVTIPDPKIFIDVLGLKSFENHYIGCCQYFPECSIIVINDIIICSAVS